MKLKKQYLIFIFITIFFYLAQWYLWIFRWDNADSNTYFYLAQSIENIFLASSYQISSLLFQPFLLLFGYQIFNLMFGSFFYRLLSYNLISIVNPLTNKWILISFILFPLHSLLSFFPGRDLFAIIFIYFSVSYSFKDKFLIGIIFALIASKFRIVMALPLLLALSFEIFNIIRFKSSKLIKLVVSFLVVFSLSIYILNNLSILGYGSDIYKILARIQLEISDDYFNLKGYTDFPRMFLNLYYPLLSSKYLSPYSLLSIESILATILIIIGFIRGTKYNIPRFIIFSSLLTLFATIIMCALYPNITDMARKIYPLFFYASIIYFHINKTSKLP